MSTAPTVTQAVARRDTGPIAIMWQRKTHFDAVLPAHLEVRGFLGTAAAALYADPKLMAAAEANPDSLIIALMECAALGHRPGTDEFYLIWRTIKGKLTVQGLEGYRGIIERMYRSGAVANVIVREVCARDRFKFVEGDMDKPAHHFGGGDGFRDETGADFFGVSGSRDRGPMVGVYAYAKLLTGAYSRVVILNRDDVHAARDAGGWKADDQYSPWNRADGGKDHPEFTGRSMWWKTAARRLEPWVPASAEYRREQLRAAAAAVAAGDAIRPPAPAGPAVALLDGEIAEAEIIPEPSPAPEPVPEATAAQVNAEFRRLGYKAGDAAQVMTIAATLAGRRASPAHELKDMTGTELGRIRDALAQCPDEAALAELLERLGGQDHDHEGNADG